MPEILTTDELAQLLKVDPMTVRSMAAAGEIGSFKVRANRKNSEYRFTLEDVNEYIEKNRVKQEVKA